MSIKSSQKSSEISVGKLLRAYKTKDLLNLSVRARGIEYCDRFLSLDNILSSRFSVMATWKYDFRLQWNDISYWETHKYEFPSPMERSIRAPWFYGLRAKQSKNKIFVGCATIHFGTEDFTVGVLFHIWIDLDQLHVRNQI